MMEFYSLSDCVHCHRVRFVLAEKGISVKRILVDEQPEKTADLAELNPYGDTPTLVDRDIVLYGTWVVTEYLDERYPHPPLMPVDPISRARLRLSLYRIQRDWFGAAEELEGMKAGKPRDKAVRDLRENINAADELFTLTPFLLNEDLSLADCALVPFLWRLPSLGVNLARNATNVRAYAQRMFERDSFRKSLTDAEKELNTI